MAFDSPNSEIPQKIVNNKTKIQVISKDKKSVLMYIVIVYYSIYTIAYTKWWGDQKKKEYKKLKKYQGLKEELKRVWKMKAEVVLVMVGALYNS